MLYDPAHQPFVPDGWFVRFLLSLAAIMRSFGAVLAMETSAILLGLPLESVMGWIPMPRRLGEIMLHGIPQAIMALLISWLLLRFAHQLPLSEIGLSRTWQSLKEAGMGVVGGGLALAITVLPGLWLGWLQFAPSEARVKGAQGVLVLTALLVIAAFAEEAIMRGYAFQTLVPSMGMLGAVVLTSGAFAAMHWGNQGANEYTMANTFLAGCVLAFVVTWRRNLWAAAGAHFGWNFATVAFGANLSGIVIPVFPYRLESTADSIFTGGTYGPEGGLICTLVLSLLLLGLIRLYHHTDPHA